MNSKSLGSATNSVDQINHQFEEREAQAKAQKYNLPYIDLAHFPLNPEVLRLLPKEKSQESQLIPFFKSGYSLRVALCDPGNPLVESIIENWKKEDHFEVEISLCSKLGFEAAFEHYESKIINRKHVELRHEYDETKSTNTLNRSAEFQKLAENLKILKPAESLNEIEIMAIKSGASDIHIQPYEEKALLRFRLNGILHDICEVPRERAEKLISQIKYDGGMKSNISHIPQDGHISFWANDRQVDLRISTLPTEFFESVVMRVLDSHRGIKTFSELGFNVEIEDSIKEALRRKNGMILVTGPTGSGKTTTLYSMLSELNSTEKKLVTLEDPIEYHLENVTQSQVDENSEYNFANGLKALLRHDPDVVLIGEIREFSTARLAAEAALTGHVVLSSLHTNSASGAVTRLRNLGLESFNIANSINAIFAQRLVREVCPHCAKKETLDFKKMPRVESAIQKVLQHHKKEISVIQKGKEVSVLTPQGCEKCSHTGFIDQTVLCEVIILTPEIREKISEGINELALERLVQAQNPHFLTLFEDGIRKMLLQETTLDEVYRVAG